MSIQGLHDPTRLWYIFRVKSAEQSKFTFYEIIYQEWLISSIAFYQSINVINRETIFKGE